MGETAPPGKPSRRISRRLATRDDIESLTFSGIGGHGDTFTMVVPEVKPEMEDDEQESKFFKATQGFYRFFANDPDFLGYTENVNRAMGCVRTPWALIWNDDAYPRFSAEDFAEALQRLPESVKCAAPAKHIAEGQVLQRLYPDAPVTIGGEQADPARKRVRTHCQMTETGPWWCAQLEPEGGWSQHVWYQIGGTGYCPLFAVRVDWFHSLGGFDMMYSPGYYEDAHFWRLTRRLGGETVVLPGFEYEHEGRGTFGKVYDKADLEQHMQENLRRYLRVWGHVI